jgi:hypothetical protein
VLDDLFEDSARVTFTQIRLFSRGASAISNNPEARKCTGHFRSGYATSARIRR